MSTSPHPTRHLRAVVGGSQARPCASTGVPLGLVEQAQAGDEQAWATIYRQTFDGLYRHIGYLIHDPVAAEDLTQETFARAFARLERFDGRSKFETWLHGIGVNVVRTHWRGSGRRDRAHERLARHLAGSSPGTRGGDPELSHARKQRAAALLEVVRELPPKLREAYILLDLRELPRDEVAEQLGVTAANLSVRASRARTKVREELMRLGWIEAEAEDQA